MDAHTTTSIRLNVRLLGRMSIHIDDRPVRITGRQSQALLALLVLRPRSRTREAIATDLWPDAASGSTGSLRQALWLVRSAVASTGTDPDGGFWSVDVGSVSGHPGSPNYDDQIPMWEQGKLYYQDLGHRQST